MILSSSVKLGNPSRSISGRYVGKIIQVFQHAKHIRKYYYTMALLFIRRARLNFLVSVKSFIHELIEF